jgi:hypothetical protein
MCVDRKPGTSQELYFDLQCCILRGYRACAT